MGDQVAADGPVRSQESQAVGMTGHDPERLAARFVPEKTQREKAADERPDRMNAAEAGLQENAVSVGGGAQPPIPDRENPP